MWFRPKLLVGAAIVIVECCAFGTKAQTLSESVQNAVSNNPKIAAFRDNRQAVESELRRARGLYYPQVDLRAGAGPEYSDNIDTRALGGKRQVLREVSGILQQRLYDGGEAGSEVERQKERTLSAANRVAENSQFTGLDAVEAHLDVIRQREILRLADANITAHRALLDRVQRRAAGGAGRQADISQAQSRLDQANAARSETVAALRDAEARYVRIVGVFPEAPAPAAIPVSAMPPTVDAALQVISASNPTVLISNADIKAAEAEIGSAASKFYPKVNLELSGNRSNNLGGTPGLSQGALAEFVLRWNLYAGGQDKANREAAYGRYNQALDSRLDALREAEQQIRQAWTAREATHDRVALLRSAVAANERVRTAYNDQFNAGQRTLFDLLDIQNEVFVTAARLATIEQQEIFLAYRILALDGRMLSALQVQLPPEADPSKPAAIPVYQKQ